MSPDPSLTGVIVAGLLLLIVLAAVGIARFIRRPRDRWEQPGDGWGFQDSRDSAERFRNIMRQK